MTQNGFLSLFATQFLVRVTSGARTPLEELVNYASRDEPRDPPHRRGQANQPVLAFPQSPGIIPETR